MIQPVKSVCLLTPIVIIGLLVGENLGLAETEDRSQFLLKPVRAQIIKRCPLWSRQQQMGLLDVVSLVFERTKFDNRDDRIKAFVGSLPMYLIELPKQMTDDEFRFISYRTEWLIEHFLSTPLPVPEKLEVLRSQVESLIVVLSDEALGSTVTISKNIREEARRILLENFMRVARNPIFPSLKRPLTEVELSIAKAEIHKRLTQTKPTVRTINKENLLQWHLGRISIVVQVVDEITKAKPPESLLRMERDYLQLTGVRNRLKEGRAYFRDVLSTPIENIQLSEILLEEICLLHMMFFSNQLQFSGYKCR